jgi:hypothetical protein
MGHSGGQSSAGPSAAVDHSSTHGFGGGATPGRASEKSGASIIRES